jgi:hypothetical protein
MREGMVTKAMVVLAPRRKVERVRPVLCNFSFRREEDGGGKKGGKDVRLGDEDGGGGTGGGEVG